VETEPELALDTDEEARPPSLHRHPLNPVSLAFGVLFLGLGLAFSLDVDMSDLSAGWAWAGSFITIGVLLLAAAVGRHHR
jgi:hypothetical protein